MSDVDIISGIARKVKIFEADAHKILSVHEASKSRLINIKDTYKKLSGLSIKQDELMREGLHCIECGLFRASHVLVWAGFMDFIEEKLASDGFIKLNSVRQNWSISTVDDLREQNDYAIIDVTKHVNLCTRPEMKALQGLLNKRNECAHPSGYNPGINEALGYVSEMFKRIEKIKSKSY